MRFLGLLNWHESVHADVAALNFSHQTQTLELSGGSCMRRAVWVRARRVFWTNPSHCGFPVGTYFCTVNLATSTCGEAAKPLVRREETGASAPQKRAGDMRDPRVVVRPKIDDGAARARRTWDADRPTRRSSIPTARPPTRPRRERLEPPRGIRLELRESARRPPRGARRGPAPRLTARRWRAERGIRARGACGSPISSALVPTAPPTSDLPFRARSGSNCASGRDGHCAAARAIGRGRALRAARRS